LGCGFIEDWGRLVVEEFGGGVVAGVPLVATMAV
jgi:hypothetical protein